MDKDKLFRTIQMYGFAIDEIVLYLDTHPNCQNALNYYHKYNELKREAVEEYNRLYGPLTAKQVRSREKWTWTNEPWPWERSAN
ncbi:MAG: spore coat protein CotJB [Oscillospiraceae bacterium]|nr:spore coat protein CotJB [Oscillospiraceae bacterium]